MARPRKDVKKKNRNGTGTVADIVQKVPRKKTKEKMCKICSECKDRSICNNRIGTKKCKKCQECRDASNCDRFYIYIKNTALSPSNGGERKYLGRFNTKKEAQENIDKSKNGGFVEKSKITVAELLYKNEEEKLNAKKINENSYSRNKSTIKKIIKCGLGNCKLQSITAKDIQELFNSLTSNLSQSSIDKIRDELNSGFKYAIEHNLLLENPLQKISKVYSDIPKEIARPFEIEEQNLLMEYIISTPILTDIRSSMDSITFKNIVRLAFASGQRIGELLALVYNPPKKSDINFQKKFFIISKTITRNKEEKFCISNCTKNSKKRKRLNLADYREIYFDIAPQNVIENIFREKIEHSKNIKNNIHHFVFCNIYGHFITHQQVTATFKIICRKLGIQLGNEKGCHIHQARHSFVTRCLEAGMKVETIADLIGDNVEQVQETYAHILPRFRKDELSKLHSYSEKNNLKF